MNQKKVPSFEDSQDQDQARLTNELEGIRFSLRTHQQDFGIAFSIFIVIC